MFEQVFCLMKKSLTLCLKAFLRHVSAQATEFLEGSELIEPSFHTFLFHFAVPLLRLLSSQGEDPFCLVSSSSGGGGPTATLSLSISVTSCWSLFSVTITVGLLLLFPLNRHVSFFLGLVITAAAGFFRTSCSSSASITGGGTSSTAGDGG